MLVGLTECISCHDARRLNAISMPHIVFIIHNHCLAGFISREQAVIALYFIAASGISCAVFGDRKSLLLQVWRWTTFHLRASTDAILILTLAAVNDFERANWRRFHEILWWKEEFSSTWRWQYNFDLFSCLLANVARVCLPTRTTWLLSLCYRSIINQSLTRHSNWCHISTTIQQFYRDSCLSKRQWKIYHSNQTVLLILVANVSCLRLCVCLALRRSKYVSIMSLLIECLCYCTNTTILCAVSATERFCQNLVKLVPFHTQRRFKSIEAKQATARVSVRTPLFR